METTLATEKSADSPQLHREPDTVPHLLMRAEQLLWSGNTAGALHQLDRAVFLDATAVERYAVGEALLRASNCRRGWDLYDLHPSRPVDRLPGVRRWDGRPCRRLILVAEQGFGDAIQFLRFVPGVTGLAENVVVAVHDELLPTLRHSSALADARVVAKSAARTTTWSADSRWERLMSLPSKIRGLYAEPVGQYVSPPANGKRGRLPPTSAAVTVGVAWKSTARRGFPNRSLPARIVSRLAARKVRLVALHRTADIRFLPRGVETVRIDNFVDTAHVISECDLVVTADTVTAHLAPALGVPTLICLRQRPDWRWGTPVRPTRWYAAAEMLFQDASENWSTVIVEAARLVLERRNRSAAEGES
jgi:hypothetical protein